MFPLLIQQTHIDITTINHWNVKQTITLITFAFYLLVLWQIIL